MVELFNATFSAVNIIPAVFLTFVLIYWLMVILGALDVSSFDLDIEVDAEVEMDGGTSEASISWLSAILRFFKIDKIPLMIFLTFWSIPLWAMSIMVNHLLANESFIFSLVLLIPILIVSLFIAKPLTMPFVKIFSKLNEVTEQSADLLGQIGKVVVRATETKIGQADVNIGGSSYRLNIKTNHGSIARGESLLIVNFSEAGKFYIVEPYQSIK
jgi:hypothetical protein